MGETCSTYREVRNVYKILVRKPEQRDHVGQLGVDETIILK
jgi:hypothetical protein